MSRFGEKRSVEKPYIRSVELRSDPDTRAYPFNIPAIANLGCLDLNPDVTFLIGENGSGKSTLLEALALAMGFGQEGGSLDHQFETTNTVSDLNEAIYLRRGVGKPSDGFFLRAESFYNFSTFIENEGSLERYGGRPHGKSHGESFLALMVNRFEGNGLYLLDEPEAALSPNRQLAALVKIHELVQQNSQLIIVTHSPILLAYPQARIIMFDTDGWHETQYEDTEHYQVTRYFLNNYKRQLERLLTDEESKDE